MRMEPKAGQAEYENKMKRMASGKEEGGKKSAAAPFVG